MLSSSAGVRGKREDRGNCQSCKAVSEQPVAYVTAMFLTNSKSLNVEVSVQSDRAEFQKQFRHDRVHYTAKSCTSAKIVIVRKNCQYQSEAQIKQIKNTDAAGEGYDMHLGKECLLIHEKMVAWTFAHFTF